MYYIESCWYSLICENLGHLPEIYEVRIIVGGSLEDAVYFLIICYTDSSEYNGDSRRKTKDVSMGIVTSQVVQG